MGLGIGLVSLAAGAVLWTQTYRRNQLQRRLVERGFSVLGRVTSVDRERVGKQMKAFLRFEFRDGQGGLVEGRTWSLTSAQERMWSAGKMIPVYYDRSDSSLFTVNVDLARQA